MCNYNEMIFILAILKKHDKKKLMMNKWITECKVREFAKCRDVQSLFHIFFLFFFFSVKCEKWAFLTNV